MARLAIAHVIVVLVVGCSAFATRADALFSRRPSATSGGSGGSGAAPPSALEDQDAWQPMHSNWIILQTAPTAPSATAAVSTAASLAYNRTSNNYSRQQQVRSQHHFRQRHQQLLQRRLDRRGDVSSAPTAPPGPTAGVGAEPFVLAFSQVPDAKAPDAFYARRQLSLPLMRGGHSAQLRRGSANAGSAASSQPTRPSRLPEIARDVYNRIDGSGSSSSEQLPPTASRPTSAATSPSQSAASLFSSSFSLASVLPALQESAEEDESSEQRLNELLEPLDRALDKVKDFCDVVKNVIGNNEDDDDAAPDSGETQGRTSQAAVGTGRKKVKKLKKKFKKFLLPLLLAYKLKFLTLIPVLIGGLTLLVGTTGLAGFFFALFTAVMSLKAGGSKSVVVKNI